MLPSLAAWSLHLQFEFGHSITATIMHSLLSSPPPKQLRTTSSLSTAFPSPSASFPPILVASSSTTLSERFRRAVIEDNLPLAKRLAAKAISISGGLSAGTTRRPSLVAGALGHGTSTASVAKKSALPSAPTLMLFPHAVSYSKAGHRAAVAQHAAASEPFDVRNVSAAAPAGSEERKTSLTIAVEHGASIEMVAWLLDMGHESEEPSRVSCPRS